VPILVIWELYKIFTPNIIDLKERYLIKRNYFNNVEVFKNSIDDLNSFQDMSIDFSEDNYMDASKIGFHQLDIGSFDLTALYENGEIGQLHLNDSIAIFDYRNEQYEIKSFKVKNTQIEIELDIDSIIILDNYWSLSYKGYCETEFFPKYCLR